MLISLPSVAWGSEFKLNAGFWDSAETQRRFSRSYSPHGDVEPRISSSERELFESLMETIRENPEEAMETLAPEITSESSAALDFTMGNLKFQSGEAEDAIRYYNQAIAKFPEFRRAYVNLGLLQVREGNFREARQALSKAIEHGAVDGNTYGLLGFSHLQLQQPISAEGAYRSALVYAPENPDWQLGLAQSLLSQRRNSEAAALFGELLRENPDNPEYWLFQANAYIAMDEPLMAASNFEIYRRMTSATAETLNTLGDIYLRDGNSKMALEAYLASVESEPTQSLSRLLNPARILIQRRDLDRAEALIAKIDAELDLLDDDDRLKVLKVQSQLALSRGQDEEAMGVLEEIVSLDPMDGEALLLLARAYVQQGKVEEAEFAFENAAGLADYEADAKVQHGQFLVSLNRYEEAVPLLRRAQQIEPRDNVETYLEQVERMARTSRS